MTQSMQRELFTPEAAPQPERRTAPDVRKPARPEPVPERISAHEPAPLNVELEPKLVPPEPEPPALDLDDLDTPAYLRQGRLLN